MDDDHFLYVIAKRCDEAPSSPVKIGISRNPFGRLRSIQTACPFPIGIVQIFTFPKREIALQMEEMLHETQSEKLLYGEWFDIEPTEAICLVCIATRVALSCQKAKEIIGPCLELSGVIAAEKALGIDLSFVGAEQ